MKNKVKELNLLFLCPGCNYNRHYSLYPELYPEGIVDEINYCDHCHSCDDCCWCYRIDPEEQEESLIWFFMALEDEEGLAEIKPGINIMPDINSLLTR